MSAKGIKTFTYAPGHSVERNLVKCEIGLWENDEQGIAQVIKPVFDSLANAFGLGQSLSFDKDGEYRF